MALLSLAPCANASALSLRGVGVYKTGETSSGTYASKGSIDPHYTAIGVSSVFIENSNPGVWIAPDTTAQYIGPDSLYTLDYDVSFDLTGYDPNSVVINGKWSADNVGNNITVNGHSTGDTAQGFSGFTSFTLNSGFKSGVNTIDFSWTNQGGPGGLLVEFTSISGNAASSTPEPSTLAIGALGLAFSQCPASAADRLSV